MTNWTKIKPCAVRGRRPALEYPRVVNQAKRLCLILPKPFNFIVGEKFDVLTDGNGRLAFVLDGTSFKVHKGFGNGKSVTVRIPSPCRTRLPYGTTRCDLTVTDKGVILDLSQFDAAVASETRIAAE